LRKTQASATYHLQQQVAHGRVLAREPTIRPASILDLLTMAQDTLQRLRGLPPSDMGAFPLVNESQRLVQQLKEAMARMAPVDQEVWQFQVSELEDEVTTQASRIMNGAAQSSSLSVTSSQRGPGGATLTYVQQGSFGPRAAAAQPPQQQNMQQRGHQNQAPAYLSTASRPSLQRPSGNAMGARASNLPSYPPSNMQHGMPPPGYQQRPPAPQVVQGVSTAAPSHMTHPFPGGMQHAAAAMQTARPLFQSPQPQSVMLHQQGPGSMPPRPAVPPSHPAPAPQPSKPDPRSALAAAIMGGHQPAPQAHPPAPASPPHPAAQCEPSMEGDMFSGLHVRQTLSPTNSQPLPSSGGASSVQTTMYIASQPVSAGGASSVQASGTAFTAQGGTLMQRQPGLMSVPSGRQAPDQYTSNTTSPNQGYSTMGAAAAAALRAARSGAVSPAPSLPPSASVGLSRVSSVGSRADAMGDDASDVQGSGRWPSNLTAAAMLARAAQSGVPVEDLATKKVIKKKTRGIKVGYGTTEEESSEPSVSHVIPGQPMPGPQYLAHVHAHQQQGPSATQAADQPDPTSASTSQRQSMAGQQADAAPSPQQALYDQVQTRLKANERMQAVLASRQAYLDAQIAAQQAATQQQVQPAPASAAALGLPSRPSGGSQNTAAPSQQQAMQQAQQAVTAQAAMMARQQSQQRAAAALAQAQAQAAQQAAEQAAVHGPSPVEPAQAQLLPTTPQSAQAPAQQQQSVPASAQPPQPAAGVPGQQALPPFVVASNNPIQDLESYLNNLSGSIPACQQAAAVAAAQLVQQFGAVIQQAQQQEKQLSGRKRLAFAKLCELNNTIAQMEQQQASLVEQEEFEQAATLDVQMSAAAAQRDQLQAGIQQVDAHVAGLADKRSLLVAKQAEACDAAAKYLARLQASHGQLMQMLEQRAAQEAESAEAAIAQRTALIENGRAALAQRKVQLAAAREDADARVRQATGPAAKERSMMAAAHEQLEREVQELRAKLAEKEAALVASAAALSQADSRVQRLASQFASATSQLSSEQEQLSAQEGQLEAQAATIEAARAATQQRQETLEQQRQVLVKQGEALAEAAEQMAAMAARITGRARFDADAKAKQGALRGAEEEAQKRLQDAARRIAEAETQLRALAAQHGHLVAERAQLADRAAASMRLLPDIEAAKKSAAAKKDFKEAARLSAAAKATVAEAEALQAKAAELQASVGSIQDNAAALERDLSALKADEPELRRAAGEARLRMLVGMVQARQQLLQAGGLSEDEVAALKAEAEADLAEAQQLAHSSGLPLEAIVAEMQQQQQARAVQQQQAPQELAAAVGAGFSAGSPIAEANGELPSSKSSVSGMPPSATNASVAGSEVHASELPGSSLPDDSRSQYAASMSQYGPASTQQAPHSEALSQITSRRASDMGGSVVPRSSAAGSVIVRSSSSSSSMSGSTSVTGAGGRSGAGAVMAAGEPNSDAGSPEAGAAGGELDAAATSSGGGMWVSNDLYDRASQGTAEHVAEEEGGGGMFDGLEVAVGDEEEHSPLPVRADMPSA